MTATIDPSAAQPRLDLDAIEARANAATPGPWQVEDGDGETDVPVGTSDGYLCCSPDDGVRGGHARADAEFIVHAHADIPALLAEVRRLRGGDGFRRESAILRWAADRAEASKVLSREAVVAQLRRWADELDAAPAAHITPTIRATIEAAIRVARADVPALVAEVRRLRAEREAPVEVLEDAMCRRIWAAALRWEADQAREAGDRYEAQGNLRAADAAKHNASVCEIDAHRIESGALSPWADPPDPDPREDAIKVLRRHYPALPVARCGQLSVHVPHMSDVGPDHPRICPGRPAELASAPPTPATEPPAAPRPAPGTPEASSGADGLILGRALCVRRGVYRSLFLHDENHGYWTRQPGSRFTRKEIEQAHPEAREVLLVDPSAGPTLDAAVQLRQAASLRAAESAEEALVAVAVGDTPGLDDADPELARKGSSPPAGHIGQPDPEPDGDIAPWCAMCRKAARADAPESADADLRRAGAVAMLRRIATAAEAAQAAYGRGYGVDDLRQWADRIASGDLPVPGSDGEGPECGTVSGPEPAGDGPGWDRDLVVELAEGIRRATSGGETAWYEVRADDAAQLRALLADRDWLAAEHDWAFNELDTTRNERDQLQANCRAAVADLEHVRARHGTTHHDACWDQHIGCLAARIRRTLTGEDTR